MNRFKFITLLTAACLILPSCTTSQAIVTDQVRLNQSKQPTNGSLQITSVLPKQSADYDASGRLAVLPNWEIWSTGGFQGKTGYFYHSSDQGKSWQARRIPLDFFSVNGDISFTDSKNGWAVGDRNILRTTDGGETWKTESLPEISNMTSLQTLRFFNSALGYIGRTTGRMNKENYEPIQGMEILCTQNSGLNWNVCYRNNKLSSIYNIVTLSETSMVGLSDGIVLLNTENNGKTWTETNLSRPVTMIAASNDGNLWAVGSDDTFQVSKDKGLSWRQAALPAERRPRNWNAIGFNTNGAGLAVGDDGIIAFSINNGQTWEMYNAGITENLYNIKMEKSFAVVSGEKSIYTVNLNNSDN